MKKLVLAAVMLVGLVGLTACVNNDTPERAKVVKEMEDFQKKCTAAPQDQECVEWRQKYSAN